MLRYFYAFLLVFCFFTSNIQAASIEEIKRLEKPHMYYVDLSKDLWILKNNMLNSIYF